MPKESKALVPARPAKQSAEKQTAADESQHKRAMLAWRDTIVDKVIKAALEDAALRFLAGGDLDADESVDLSGAYDPIVNEQSGQRLSDAIDEAAERFQQTAKAMRQFYLTELKKKWKSEQRRITKPIGPRYGAYMVSRHGVWTKQYVDGGDGHSPYVWRRIAKTRIEPVALSRDTSTQRNWRTHFQITDETGEFAVDVGAEHVAKKAERAIVTLIKHGVRVVESDDARAHLAIFLRFRPKARIIRAPATGWFSPQKNKWVFVLPTETLGDTGGVGITLDNVRDDQGLHCAGTSDEWRQYVAAPLARNSNVILSVGTFLAGPVLHWADEPGGGFHLHNKSKIGKTLAGAIGQSVWGKPYFPGAGSDAFGFTWESTANRLGQRAALRNDLGLSLDEIGVGNPHPIAIAVYKLAGGLDKGRYGQPEASFNVLVFSTGEPSLAEFLPNVRAGQLVRMVDVPALVKPGSASALETVPESEIAEAGARFYPATRDYHGEVGHDWLKHLVALGPTAIKAELKTLRRDWLALPRVAQIKSRAHPQVVSVINRFALVAAVLNMAIAAGILPWATADTDAGVIACMERWLLQRGNTDAAGELLQDISRRRQTFAATIDDRLIGLSKDQRGRLVPASAADQNKMAAADRFDGFVKDDQILLKPEAFQRLWAGLDLGEVKKYLLGAQLLIPSASGDVPSLEKFKSGAAAARFYVLAPEFAGRRVGPRYRVTDVTEGGESGERPDQQRSEEAEASGIRRTNGNRYSA